MFVRALLLSLLATVAARGEIYVDAQAFGDSLGGWKTRKGKAAEYQISGAMYCTYQPEVTPSPDGGIFISLRIDHLRGFLASDDHASLELSFTADGTLVSAQSALALQGRTISSELIRGGASATTSVAAPQIDRAVKIGSDLVADLSSKLLREKIVEPGRVSFPAAIRHNYNLLYKAVKPVPVPKIAVLDTAPEASPTGDRPKPSSSASSPASSNAPTTPAPTTAAPPPSSVPVPTAQPSAAPQPQPAATPPPAPAPPASAGAPTTALNSTAKKEIPLPEIKYYNGGIAPQTPLPAKEKKKSLVSEYGDDALKIARDLAKDQLKK